MTSVDNFGHPINDAPDPGAPTTTPPQDGHLWFREDHVEKSLNRALQSAIRNHTKFLGNDVKSVCWDVREEFGKALKNVD